MVYQYFCITYNQPFHLQFRSHEETVTLKSKITVPVREGGGRYLVISRVDGLPNSWGTRLHFNSNSVPTIILVRGGGGGEGLPD